MRERYPCRVARNVSHTDGGEFLEGGLGKTMSAIRHAAAAAAGHGVKEMGRFWCGDVASKN